MKGFKVVHLPAMMGLCWNGKVHQTGNVPLSPLDQEATKATFNKLISNLQYHLQIPTLLASFRAAGLRVHEWNFRQLWSITDLFHSLNYFCSFY